MFGVQVIVTLHGGDDYRFINVEDYGFVSAYRPRLSAGDVQTMVEVSGGWGHLTTVVLGVIHI